MMKHGVLYTNTIESEIYHLLLGNEHIIEGVMLHDRRADGEVYIFLYGMMQVHNLDVLWVHPDTQLSIWVQRNDFLLIDKGLRWFSPYETSSSRSDRPYGIRLRDKYVFFPAHGRMTKEVGNKGQWVELTPDSLYKSVDYVQKSIDMPFLWSAGYTAMQLLKQTATHVNIEPFTGSPLWGEAVKRMVCRPSWIHRLPDGTRGLTDEQKGMKYLYGFDKNNQFLGACINLQLGNGNPVEIVEPDTLKKYPLIIFKDQVAFWEYEITDVSNSVFNGYDLYCPLSKRYNWASAELLNTCQLLGIKFTVKRGLVWQKRAGRVLTPWAERIRNGIQVLDDREEYPDMFAAQNAKGTLKLSYVEMIGRLCAEYSKEFYHRDWNMFVVHKAIANQLQTVWKREREGHQRPVIVSNDSMYVLSNEDEPNVAYRDILNHTHELRGYKLIGKCRLSDTLIDAFEDESRKVMDVEALIKQQMDVYKDLNAKSRR
jgi:hypothetical protein